MMLQGTFSVVCRALVLLAAGSAGAATPPASLVREFTVFLDERRIGTHRFEVAPGATDGDAQVRSDARFEVRILGIPLYRYRHTADEQWSGGCLRRLVATTNDNGDSARVEASAAGTGDLAVTGARPAAGGVRRLSGCVWSYAYWNPAIANRERLLNPQTGEYEEVRFVEVGLERLSLRDRQVDTRRTRLESRKFRIDLWHALDGEWLQLESSTPDGRRLRYLLSQ